MKIYNTMTRQKEEFVPMVPGEAKIYACGPTVYNFIHIGNARPICVFDVLRRYLEYRGMNVTFVQNFTDIDDKIIRKANEEGTDYLTVSRRYMEEYKKDAAGLNVRPATVHPLATENIDEIIAIISTLVEKGYAYPAEMGTYISVPVSLMNTANCPISRWKICRRVPASAWVKSKKMRWILLCGRAVNPANPIGNPPGAKAVPVGILNAAPWCAVIWVQPLTFTAAGRT